MIPSFIGLAFGALWLTVAVGAAAPPWHLVAGIVGGLLFVGAAIRIVRRSPRGGRFDGRWYLGAVVAEVVAIGLAQSWLVRHHRENLLFPTVGIIVGVHFLGLWRAMGLRRFVALAGGLVALNLAALLLPLPQPGRLMLSGFGSALALLVTAAA